MCYTLTCMSSFNTWAFGDSPLTQLVKELDMCLFLCVNQRTKIESQQSHSIFAIQNMVEIPQGPPTQS